MHIQPVPTGSQPLIAYLVVHDAARAIEYYKNVFAAEEVMRMECPQSKKIVHAELRIAGCMVYLADEHPGSGSKSPKSLGHTTVGMAMYCLDADKVFARAVKSGSKVMKPMENQFWGDRMGTVTDPFGHSWTMIQRVEEVSPAQMMERMQAMAGKA